MKYLLLTILLAGLIFAEEESEENQQFLPTEPPEVRNVECVGKDDIKHYHGSTWIENVIFQYKCEEFGEKTLKGCIVWDLGMEIPIGETRQIGNLVFHCEIKAGSSRFYTTINSVLS
ncbi:hypothetical protein PMAYCL1PPCAC_28383 [Pristionchus mayeri]|uniref:Abnormal cell migration protein 18-like fibronectin type I domain-containing protein n=1 Tax=Pristionchus mayeri TaxID=1317129 RepID=A0AAN5D7I3_9BILA|nr:hypothetical protein PMAYCL1PPCAC_28383 [Pristionchus mayeri]